MDLATGALATAVELLLLLRRVDMAADAVALLFLCRGLVGATVSWAFLVRALGGLTLLGGDENISTFGFSTFLASTFCFFLEEDDAAALLAEDDVSWDLRLFDLLFFPLDRATMELSSL